MLATMYRCVAVGLGLFLFSHFSQAQTPIGIPLKKQVDRSSRGYNDTFTGLIDSVLPRDRAPRAIKRGIVKSFAYLNFAGKREELQFVVGQNRRGDQIGIVADVNRNADFRDDPLLWFKNDSSKAVKPRQYCRVMVPSPRGPIPFFITPSPYPGAGRYNIRLEQKYYLMIGLGELMAGRLPMGGPTDSIRVINAGVALVYTNRDNRLSFMLPGSTEPDRRYNLGDVFTLHDSSYVATRITPLGDSLYVLPLTAKTRQYYGVAEGSRLPINVLRDLNDKPVELAASPRRVLLDFWGTWCAPCRELTPDLQALHQANQKSLRLVSIALDDKEPVAKYLQEHAMPWEQVAISRAQTSNTLIDQLRVEAYPTFILVENGLIVYRGTGKPGLQAIQQYLTDHPAR
ncbi:TlpA disulfide reductase family protein [Hymenobacter sp. GOD-10R]|uniref:TlpA family protein disulfide reductase n=1 Tax=Hymenobacter sp. GOD-10R TaxID=3093922 RepID=UPI002D79D57C|nr:TlpA disulfide reductase family protein [Hymenobacter sp. GOD-10R]WRQ28545.1 TlpA disulfide reductase family protein [Hymenobacter sp. GOD-10R]